MRGKICLKHYNIRTEQSNLGWIKRLIPSPRQAAKFERPAHYLGASFVVFALNTPLLQERKGKAGENYGLAVAGIMASSDYNHFHSNRMAP